MRRWISESGYDMLASEFMAVWTHPMGISQVQPTRQISNQAG